MGNHCQDAHPAGGPAAVPARQFEALNTARMAGWLHTSIFRSDTDTDEYWMLAMFESKEAYQRNAESSTQHQVYLMLRSLMTGDPEWHDVDEVRTMHAL